MKNTLSKTLIFAAGALVGSAVTWYFAKGYFAKIAQEEIDSVKEAFSKIEAKPEEEQTEPKEGLSEEEVARAMPVYQSLVREYDSAFKSEEKEVSDVERPYIIQPGEFHEFYDYEPHTLTWYADGILADDTDEIIDDIDGTVGLDNLDHFGENPDDPDTIYVRNDKLQSDYEILKDNGTYAEIVGVYEHLTNGE